MKRRFTVIVEREGDRYFALCPEVDVANQGSTIAEAYDNIIEAVTNFWSQFPPVKSFNV